MKKNNGVTLVALIITIIILLILAGVVITMTVGDEGLFSTVKRAVSNYENATEQELEYFNQMNDMIEKTMRGELTISIDNINLKGFKINVTNTKSHNSDNITFEYYLDGIKVASTKEKYYVINNIDWTKEHTVYVKEFNRDKLKNTSEKYHLKNGEIPKLTANNSYIISPEGEWWDDASDICSPTGMIYKYYAFDKDANTYAGSTTGGDSNIGYSIGYDFGKPVMVYNASGKIRMLGYKIQASNDSENWEDIITSSAPWSDYSFSHEITNGKEYRYWRLYVNGGQLQSNYGALVYELQFNHITITTEN